MLAIDSLRTERLLFGGWCVTAVLNLGLMWILPGKETVPFHLVWIGLSIVYGLMTWRLVPMTLVLIAVAVSTGYILIHHAQLGAIGWEETTEVPLMSAVFVVMVWHVRRRQQMVAEVARMAELDRRRAESHDRFMRLASHELRTPITIARGYTEMVRAATSDEAIQSDISIVLDELDRLTGITQRLVTLIQLETPYQREMRDVDAVLERIVLRWRPTADRQWTVRSTIGEEWINHDRLETALDCLLENALKFTGPGDRIAGVGEGTRDGWSVTVTDSGTGMSPQRVEALNTGAEVSVPPETHSGTGLGLAIVRAVVGSSGGRLDIASEPGSGTTVILHFRRFVAPLEPAPVAARLPGAPLRPGS
jgi:signal transduction histidine kinase